MSIHLKLLIDVGVGKTSNLCRLEVALVAVEMKLGIAGTLAALLL